MMPLSPEEWGEFIQNDQQQQAKSSLLGDLMSPDVAAKTLANSAERGIPFALNTAAPEDFNKESMINRAQEVANDDPIVQRYLANNDFAAHVSHDDLENLSVYGKSLKAITSGWAGGRALSKFGASSGLSIAQRETELPPEAEKFWKENEEAKKNIPEGGWYHTLAGFSQFLGQVIEGTQEISRKYPMKTPETAGEAVMAGIGDVVRVASMIPAAIMTPMNLARDTGNEIYVRHQKEAAAAGLPFDADATAAASTIGALATIAMLKVGPVQEAGGFIKELAAGALENSTVKRGLGYYMREITKSGAIFGAAGLGQTLIQTYAEDIAREASSPEFKTIMNDPQKRQELKDNLIEAAAGGFVLGAAMHIPHVGVSYLNDRRLIAEARADQQNYKDASLSAAKTETYDRSPRAFKAFTKEAAEGHEIGIPADAIIQAFGDKALEKFGFVKDFEAKLQAANERGGDVKIPMEDWLVALKDDPALGPAFEEDLRVRPEGLTMREADALKEAKPENYAEVKRKGLEPSFAGEINWDEEHGRFEAKTKEGKVIGSLDDTFPPDQQAFTPYVEVAEPWRRQGVATALYKAFAERHGGNIRPAGNTSPGAWELWLKNYPEKVVQYVKEEAGKIADDVRSGNFPPEYAENATNGFDHPEVKNMVKDAIIADLEGREFNPTIDARASGEEITVKPPASPEEAIFEEAGKAAKKELWLNPLFDDDKWIGKDEFARYSKKLEAQAADARDKAVKQAAKAIGKRETAEWKENERRVRDEVSLDLAYRPDLMADTFFRTGKYPGVERMKGFKLDSDVIRDRYGADALSALDPSTVSDRGGVDPDDAAGLFGFRSGDGLVDGLKKIRRDRGEVKGGEYLKGLIDRETAERMEHQYGVLSENIMEKSREDVGTGGQADLLADETHYLQTLLTHKDGEETQPARQITAELIAERAKEATKTALAKDVANIGEITRDVGRAGRQAELALLKEDIPEAFKAKQRQAITMALLRVAKEFIQKVYNPTEKRIERFSKNAVVAGVDQAYTDQIHNLLSLVGENIPRTEENLTRALDGEKIDEFIARKAAKDGRVIPPTNLPPRKPLSEFTTEEYRDFAATLQSLEFNGRQEKQIDIGNKTFDYETAVAQGLENLDSLKKGGTFDPRKMEGLRHTTRKLDASMMKMEQLFDWADKNDPTGVFNRLVFRPFSEAEHWKLDKLTGLSRDFDNLPKGLQRRRDLNREVPNETLLDPKTNLPVKLKRGNMLKMALDWGNASNREKLLKGWGWEESDVTDLFNRNMTKKDWDYVQKMFDVTAKLGPDIQRVTKALSGIETDLIEPKEIVTPFGTYKGGYIPLIEDKLSRINREKVSADVFENAMFHMLPTTQAVKRRTGKIYPVSLEMDDIPGILVDTVHYLAFAEPMANARKFLGDKLIREGISDAFGPEYTEQLNPWLEHIATNGGEAAYRHLDWWNKLSREARMNVQTALVGFNLGTTAIHGASAFFNSTTEVGRKYMGEFFKALPTANKDHLARTVDSFFRNTKNAARMTDFAMENSGELRNRKLKVDNNMQTQWQAAIGKSSLRASFQQYSMSLLAHFDMMSAIPTWHAVYTGKIREGVEHSDAVYAADKAVRNAHGASGITDLAPVQRGPEFMKWATMFMGYFVHNYNRNRDTVRIMEGKTELDGWGKWGTVAGRTMGYVMAPAVFHYLIRGPQNDDASWGEVAADLLLPQVGGGIPYLRDIIHSALTGHGVKQPMESAMDGFITPLKDATHALTGHKVSDNWVKHVLAFPGWTLGLSSNFVAQEGQYLWDLNTGRQAPPKDFKEWFNGIMHGKTEPK
jgi:GNAT superfamily N-acetyltransferase